jgi:hypothetical protein
MVIRSSCGPGKGTRMQQSIIDKSAPYKRGSLLPWPKRLPASVGADRPRGNDCAILTKAYVLRRAPLRLGVSNSGDSPLSLQSARREQRR